MKNTLKSPTPALMRITLASAGGWMQMAMNLCFQLAAVPLFLSHWSAATYAIWILTISSGGLLSIADLGHQNFLGYLMMKQSSSENISRIAFSAIPPAIVMAILQFFVTIVIFIIVSNTKNQYRELGLPLLIYSASWGLFGSVGGIFGRSLLALNCQHRLAWWSVMNIALQQATPVIICLLGGGIVLASIGLFFATAFYNLVFLLDVARSWKLQRVSVQKINLRYGFANALASVAVTVKETLTYVRQAGVRLVVAPLLSVNQVTNFSVTRTAANVTLQGLNTVLTPVEPEMLRLLREEATKKFEFIFTGTLAIVTFGLNFGLITLQFIAPFVFRIWTRGRLPFDPLLFSLFSAGVAIFGISQPFTTIIRGNNLLKAQMFIALISAIVTIGGVIWLTGKFGVEGSAVALAASEVVALALSVAFALRWLSFQHLKLDDFVIAVCLINCFLSSLNLVAIAELPQFRLATCGFYFLVQLVTGGVFYIRSKALIKDVSDRFGRLIN